MLNIKASDVLEELSEQMKIAEEGNARVTLWIGRMLKVANYLANVVGFMAIFLRPNPVIQFQRLISSGSLGDKFVLLIGFIVATGIAYGIYHFEISGLAHFRTSNWALFKLAVGYPSGSLLNFVSFLLIAPLPDEFLAAAPTVLILLIAAFLLDFLGDVLVADAQAALARKKGERDIDSEHGIPRGDRELKREDEVPVRVRNPDNGKVRILQWRGFKKDEPCSAPSCQAETRTAVVADVDGKQLNYAPCRKHRPDLEKDPNVLLDWVPR